MHKPPQEAPKKKAGRRSPKKKGAAVEEEKEDPNKKKTQELKPVRLPKPIREEDEYEDILRRHFLSVEKRKKEAEEERKRREAEELELQRQNEKFREELATREITYDSKGTIIFVDQRPNAAKLPPSILPTGYKMPREDSPQPTPQPKKKGASRGAARAKPKKPRKAKPKGDPEFPDSFSRLTTLQ